MIIFFISSEVSMSCIPAAKSKTVFISLYWNYFAIFMHIYYFFGSAWTLSPTTATINPSSSRRHLPFDSVSTVQRQDVKDDPNEKSNKRYEKLKFLISRDNPTLCILLFYLIFYKPEMYTSSNSFLLIKNNIFSNIVHFNAKLLQHKGAVSFFFWSSKLNNRFTKEGNILAAL